MITGAFDGIAKSIYAFNATSSRATQSPLLYAAPGRGRQQLQETPRSPETGSTPVSRPRPGGRNPRSATAPDTMPMADLPAPTAITEGSLVTPAMPLLQLMARLRTMASQPNPATLWERTEADLHAFESRAEKSGMSADLIRRGSYVLCASLDDLVLNTPWGAKGAWATRPLVTALHPTVSTERFFDLARQAQEKVTEFRPVLELIFACISLGMMGRYRVMPQGHEALEQLRTSMAAALAASASPVAPELSPRWQGVAMPFVARPRRLKLWVVFSLATAAVAALFAGLTLRLNDRSDALFARMLAAPPSHMPQVTRQAVPPPPPAPQEPSAQDRLRDHLAQAIAAGQLTVVGTPTMPIIRIPEQALFSGSSAALLAQAEPLLGSVAMALNEGGALDVVGYTDNRSIHTVLFPSSFQLSAARAQAVRSVLARTLDGGRLRSEGRAAADPIASNATAEGRAQNRRIEIMIDGAGL